MSPGTPSASKLRRPRALTALSAPRKSHRMRFNPETGILRTNTGERFVFQVPEPGECIG